MSRIYDENAGGPVAPFVYPPDHGDPHAVYSLTVREIVEDGFDVFGDVRWADVDFPTSADNEWLNNTRERVQEKFLSKFWWAEIDPRVPARWRYNVTTRALLMAPKYKPRWEYQSRDLDPLKMEDTYGKSRRVYSEFPATQLDANVSDYASTADDNQYETVREGDVLGKFAELRGYEDTDELFLREFELCFSQVLTFTLGGM